MNIDKDYYAALGVEKNADAAAIKKAYRKLARELHPDKNPNDPAAADRFKAVSEAYDTLSDTGRRAKYDEARALLSRGADAAYAPGGSRTDDATFDISDLFDSNDARLSDLFGDLFGNAGTPGSGPDRRARQPSRGPDAAAGLQLSFEDAVRGTTVPLHLSFPSPCPRCHGTGNTTEGPCPNCSGTGTVEVTDSVTVRIPAGVHDGAQLRVPGHGRPGPGGTPRGDLLVTVHVTEHPLFGRSGDDLTVTVPISYPEAALGATVHVPTLDSSVAVRIPAGTPTGRTLRVRGHGVTRGDRHGDLLITVAVAVPAALSPDAREALRRYADTQRSDPREHITAALAGRDRARPGATPPASSGNSHTAPRAGTKKARRTRKEAAHA